MPQKASQLANKRPAWLSKSNLFHLNFYRVHLAYFIFTILLASVIMYGSTTNGNSGDAEAQFYLRYIDALFLCTSAMTNTGLNDVNLGSITAFQQVILYFLMAMGNVMTVSASTVYIRRYFVGKKIRDVYQHSKAAQDVAGDVEAQGERSRKNHPQETDGTTKVPRHHPSTQAIRRRQPNPDAEKDYYQAHHYRDHGGIPMPWQSRTVRDAFHAPFASVHRKPHDEPHDYISFQPALDFKGRFHSLDERQREELGGVEYRALELLSWLLPAYILFWTALGIVTLVPYSYYHSMRGIIDTSQPGNLLPGWWAAFVVTSAFTNSGLNLLNSNMVPFQTYYLVLIVCGALILLGNQLFPAFLRFIIWCMYKLLPKNSRMHHTVAFLLHHPRRCFILLFPSDATWYLLAAQLSIDFVLWAFFGILNIGLPAFSSISAGTETIMGLFQALAVRVGGFYVILISNIAPSLQIMYVVAMYISAFPILLSLRQTNIYEERSIGVDHDPEAESGSKSYLGEQISKQLAYDLWWLALAVWLISIIERTQIVYGGDYFTIWAIIFETVSAYGTVGITMGVPYDDYSFSGSWHTLSKLILICVMIRGRHRSLPYAIDRAVLLPGQELMDKMDHEINERGRGSHYREEEKEVRREEQGAQAEDAEESQDPQQDRSSDPPKKDDE